MKKFKKICISGYYGFDNFGDETILDILISNLKSMENIGEITVFSSTPLKTAEVLKVKSVYTFNFYSVLSSIIKCDCLISGGGSLLQDVTSVKSLLYYLFVIAVSELFGKKVIIFAQGIGPIHNLLLKNLTMFLLKRTVFITVRDEISFNLLKDNGINNVKKCFDPVWNIEIDNKACNNNKIGIQLRDFPLVTDNFLKQLAININNYYSEKEINLLSLQNKLDLPVCEKFKSVLIGINPKLTVNIIKNTSNKKVIEDICSLDILIAMRYHACMIGIKAGIKVLPVNYDIKVKSLADEFNLIYINSEYDMDDTFKHFVQNVQNYDTKKIDSYKFDFNELRKKIFD